MAILRAQHLSAATTPNRGPVLLVTYNNALVAYLSYLQPATTQTLTIRTYARFARGYLKHVGLMPSWGGIADPDQRRWLVAQAVKETAEKYPTSRFFVRDTRFFLDELEWISGMGLSTLADYKATKRFGRRTGLTGTQHEQMWEILLAYQRLRAEAGLVYDWYDLASAVRAALARDTQPRMYRHVVIDEGQDLSPQAIRSLVEVIQPGGSVTFFGDYHQQIYGQGLSWRSCGLNIRAIERFADNYRNTVEVARLAIAMSRMPHMASDPNDLVEPREPTAAGALPTLVACRDEAHEMKIVRVQARDLALNRTVAVLARTWAEAQQACQGLRVRKLHRDMNSWDATPGIYCGVYHSAKGLEFDAVILPFCGSAHMPHREVITAFGEEEGTAREARLLYVGITRAKTDLLITYSGEVSPLLPTDDTLYARVTA
jgi:superfamily I DNA/RNA helicase